MKYDVGIDAGGTSSKIECYDKHSSLVYSLNRPGLQASGMKLEEISSAIDLFVKEISKKFDGNLPDAVACGIAGAGRTRQQKTIQRYLKSQFPHITWYITSDLRAAHAGGFANKNGILIIAGTGSVVLGRLDNRWKRAGGYGYLVRDEGSGTDLGQKAVHAAAHFWDGGPETAIVDYLNNEHDIRNINQLMEALYTKNISVSVFAKILIQAAADGDKIAKELCEEAITELVEKAGLVLEVFPPEERKVILHGGLFNSDYYKNLFLQIFATHISTFEIKQPQFSAPKGACLLMKNMI